MLVASLPRAQFIHSPNQSLNPLLQQLLLIPTPKIFSRCLRASSNSHVEFDFMLGGEYPGLYHGILDIKFKVPRMSPGY